MPEIKGSLSRDGTVKGVCVWCSRPSTSEAEAPGIGRVLPLHVLCAAAVISAYRAWEYSGRMTPALLAYMDRIEPPSLLEIGEIRRIQG